MKEKQQRKKAKEDLKIEVLSHYSGNNPPICGKCCTTDLSELTIDHVYNDGSAMREKYPYQKKHLLRWLKNNGFPDGYQVLCKKCNQEKNLDLKLYMAGGIERLSREQMEDYIRNKTTMKIDGDFVIREDNKRIPIGQLYKARFKVSDPMKAQLSSGNWIANQMSFITEDYKDRSIKRKSNP